MVALDEGSLVIYSPSGQAWAVDERLVPDGDQTSRAASELAGLASGEPVQAMLLRRKLRGARRACHVTAQGRIKASDSADLIHAMSREGAQAYLLADGDQAVAVFGQEGGQTTIFCAARNGNGIHFKASDVRTMGLRAQGVKAMELGEDDAIVGAAAARGKEQVLVLSQQGCGKRVSLEEFRVQGRGGQGMILMRPHLPGDGLAAMSLIGSLDEDVLVLTSRGRLARVAVTAFPLLGRSSRGEQVLALEGAEQVVSARALPGAGA
jgi:DNA gyrase subunit A